MKLTIKARHFMGEDEEVSRINKRLVNKLCIYYPELEADLKKTISENMLITKSVLVIDLACVSHISLHVDGLGIYGSDVDENIYWLDIITIETTPIVEATEQMMVDSIMEWFKSKPVLFTPSRSNIEDMRAQEAQYKSNVLTNWE